MQQSLPVTVISGPKLRENKNMKLFV